jgi:hypothetical protein
MAEKAMNGPHDQQPACMQSMMQARSLHACMHQHVCYLQNLNHPVAGSSTTPFTRHGPELWRPRGAAWLLMDTGSRAAPWVTPRRSHGRTLVWTMVGSVCASCCWLRCCWLRAKPMGALWCGYEYLDNFAQGECSGACRLIIVKWS